MPLLNIYRFRNLQLFRHLYIQREVFNSLQYLVFPSKLASNVINSKGTASEDCVGCTDEMSLKLGVRYFKMEDTSDVFKHTHRIFS